MHHTYPFIPAAQRVYLVALAAFILSCVPNSAQSADLQAAHMEKEAMHLCDIGDFERASEVINKAIKREPNNPDYHESKAQILWLEQENDGMALEENAIACKLRPNAADFWSKRAEILFRMKRKQEALDAINKSIKLYPTSAFTYEVKAGILADTNRKPEAEAVLTEGLKHADVDLRDLHSDRAVIAAKLAHWQLVIEDTEAVLAPSRRPAPLIKRQGSYKLLIQACTHLKLIEKGKRTCVDAQKSLPDSRPIIESVLTFYRSIGDKKGEEEATRTLKRYDDAVLPMP